MYKSTKTGVVICLQSETCMHGRWLSKTTPPAAASSFPFPPPHTFPGNARSPEKIQSCWSLCRRELWNPLPMWVGLTICSISEFCFFLSLSLNLYIHYLPLLWSCYRRKFVRRGGILVGQVAEETVFEIFRWAQWEWLSRPRFQWFCFGEGSWGEQLGCFCQQVESGEEIKCPSLGAEWACKFDRVWGVDNGRARRRRRWRATPTIWKSGPLRTE